MPTQPNLPISNDIPLIPALDVFEEWDPNTNRLLIQEPLIMWAAHEWRQRFGEQESIVLWTSGDCINRLALQRVKPGRKLGTLGNYVGFEPIPCPVAFPINWRKSSPRTGVVPSSSAGAMIFTFEKDGLTLPVLYVSLTYHDLYGNVRVCPIALCPPSILNLYQHFEGVCMRVVRDVVPTPKIQVVGGQEESFEARVEWEDVILDAHLKAEIKHEMDAFFDAGVTLYRELSLAPFRKLLFVGPPGTGKSTLCAGLAKLAIKRKMLVIYVSAADIGGASFGKIYQALRLVAEAKYPTLLIIEELDVYLRAEDKSQILNVLDGLEVPNNPRGVLMLATTNYPEIIDERIAKRPGRIDRIFVIPPIVDRTQAEQMLRRYMSSAFHEGHIAVLPDLVGKTGAFVREISLHSRMAALNAGVSVVSLEMLKQSIKRLDTQLGAGPDLRTPLIEELPDFES